MANWSNQRIIDYEKIDLVEPIETINAKIELELEIRRLCLGLNVINNDCGRGAFCCLGIVNTLRAGIEGGNKESVENAAKEARRMTEERIELLRKLYSSTGNLNVLRDVNYLEQRQYLLIETAFIGVMNGVEKLFRVTGTDTLDEGLKKKVMDLLGDWKKS